MGYTMGDAAREMAEQEEAEEAAEKELKSYEHLRRSVEAKRAADMAEVSRVQQEEYQSAVQDLFGERDDSDLAEFTAYTSNLMERIEHLKDSIPRGVILSGLATMEHYSALVGRDGDTKKTILDGITEPPSHTRWGPRGKPANTYSHHMRMYREGLCGNVDIEVEGIKDVVIGLRALPEGIAYAVHHGYLGVEALVECWRTGGVGPQKTTNEWALLRADPFEDDAGFQFTTSNEWACLAVAQEWDNDIEGRYAEKRPPDIARAFTASHNQDADEAFRFLDDEHRQDLIEEVLRQSEVGSNNAVFANIVGQIASKRSLEDRVASMVEYYASGNPCGPDDDGGVDVPETERRAKATVEELVCRFTWVIVRRLMDRRMNVSAPEARPSQDAKEVSLAALLTYLRRLPEVAQWTVHTQHHNAEGRRPDITIEINQDHALIPDLSEEEPF